MSQRKLAILIAAMWVCAPAVAVAQTERFDSSSRAQSHGMNWGVGWLAEVEGGRTFVPQSTTVCTDLAAQISGISASFACDNDTRVSNWGGSLGVTFARFVAIKVGYLDLGRVNANLTGQANGTGASATGFFGPTQGLTLQGGLRFDVGPVVPFVEGGVFGWQADTGATVGLIGVPASVSVSRRVMSWNPIVGGGLEIWPARYVGFDAGIRFVKIHHDVSSLDQLVNLDDTFRMAFVGIKIGGR